MLSTSVQAAPLSPNPATMHETRTRPSPPHPQTAASAASGSTTSPPSASASTSADALTSTGARPSFNLRDFMVDDDADSSVFKFMDEDAIIRAQVEALKVLNDAALSRALRESEATAALEDMRRKQQLKQEEPFSQDGAETSPPGPSAAMNSPSPVMDQFKREAQRQTSPPSRSRSDEAAARLLAREWKVASLQGALFENPRIMPLLSPISSPSFTTSASSAAAAAARKVPLSSTRPVPITIPAKEFYSRSPPQSHHRQGSTSRSSTSSGGSPPQTPFVAPDPKDKPQPRLYTSASSAAAAQAAAKLTSSADKARISPTKTSFGPVYASASQSQQTSPALVPSASSARAPDNSKRASAEITPLPRKSTSPERARTAKVPPAAATSTLEYVPNLGQKAHTSTSSSTSGVQQLQSVSKMHTVTDGPRSLPGFSSGTTAILPVTPQPTVMTSASKVAAAAEKEKARSRQASAPAPALALASTSTSASTSAATSRASSSSRPVSREAPASSTSSVATPSPRPPSPAPAPAKLVPQTVRTGVPAPDGEPASSNTPQKEGENSMVVVPISSLSDPEDDGNNSDTNDEGDEEEEEEDEDEEEEEEKDTSTESIPFRHLYTANRSCSKCGESMLSPRRTLATPADPFSFPFIELLHVSCTSCGALHCRGCSSLAKCPKSCLGSKSCSVKDCCPQVCAIAIFEALGAFDHEFSKEAGLSGVQKNGRDEYIQTMISRPTSQTKKLELTFLRTMRTLTALFQSSQGVHPTVGEVFERSLMPEVIHGFLRSTNVRDWIAHSDTYCAILTLLRYMVEGGSGDVMTAPLRRIETSCGLRDWMWGKGTIVWASGETDVGASNEGRNDREMYRGELKGGAEKPVEKREQEKTGQCASAAPLGSLMKQLEAHRRPLLALAAKVQFPATVEKVNGLCDGISYLVLQQVLGSI